MLKRFAIASISIGCCSLHPAALAQPYPARTVRMIVPFPAGGGADIIARLVSRKLTDSLAQSFVADNRTGASGIIACELVARAAPDGYTLLLGTTGSHATNPAVLPKLPYDAIRDFAPISLVADAPFVLLVHPSLPARSVKELIALAKARPGQLSYGSSGIGSTAHLGFELFNSLAGIKTVHVPYKGLGQAATDTIAGNITMFLGSIAPAVPHIRLQRLRALGTGSTKRSSLLPDIPTIAEAGLPGYELGSWYGVFAPAGTPPDIVRLLQREIVKGIAAADVREQLSALGAEPVGSAPEEFATVLKRDLAKWTKIAREVKIQAE